MGKPKWNWIELTRPEFWAGRAKVPSEKVGVCIGSTTGAKGTWAGGCGTRGSLPPSKIKVYHRL